MGIPDHLTCLLRNVYAGQESTVRTGHGTTDWFQIGKGVRQGCILLLYLFNFYAEYIMQNARLNEEKAWINTARRNIIILRYADDTILTAEREKELKILLIRVKEESEKAGLIFNIQKTKIILFHHFMANRWGRSGNSGTFYFLGLQNHCKQWRKRWNSKTLAPWKKSYDKPR